MRSQFSNTWLNRRIARVDREMEVGRTDKRVWSGQLYVAELSRDKVVVKKIMTKVNPHDWASQRLLRVQYAWHCK